jgi:hypothetical protein
MIYITGQYCPQFNKEVCNTHPSFPLSLYKTGTKSPASKETGPYALNQKPK